jgi:hypothetical protein
VSVNEARRAVLLAEYSAANDTYLQYDGYRWQAGSFLIAGVFIYWGFLLQSRASASVIGVSSLLVAGLMSCWLLFASHYRQLYLFKLHRLWEIETDLGMEQHLRFLANSETKKKYKSQGIKGHNIDQIVYCLTSVGGIVLAWTHNGFSWWDVIVLPLVVAVVLWVRLNENRVRDQLPVPVAAHRPPDGIVDD